MMIIPAQSIAPSVAHGIEQELSEYLRARFPHAFQSAHVAQEYYGRDFLALQFAISIENYSNQEAILLYAVAPIIRPLLVAYPQLHGVVTRVDIDDDKVGISDRWFDRTTIIESEQQPLTPTAFIEQSKSYW